LDVTFTINLKFYHHIKKAVCKASRMIGIIYCTFHVLTLHTLCLLYISLVRPILDYACVVWQPYLLKGIRALEESYWIDIRNLAHLTYTDILKSLKFALTVLSKIEDGYYCDKFCTALSTYQSKIFSVQLL